MKERLKLAAALCLAASFLLFPEAAVNGARDSARLWALRVVPALFPYLVILPVIGSGYAQDIYRKRLRGVMKKFFGLLGESAAVIAVGMLAGSPAGSLLCRAGCGGMTGREIRRTVLPVCGLSPGFLIAGVGVGMMGSAAAGYALAIGQAVSQLILLVLLRFLYRAEEEVRTMNVKEELQSPVRYALTAIGSVGGYMIAFGAVGGVVRRMLGEEAGGWLMYFLDFPNGVAEAIGNGGGIAAVGFLAGFAGICIASQNMGILGKMGIGWGEYLAVRLCGGSLCAVTAAGMYRVFAGSEQVYFAGARPVQGAILCMGIFLILFATKHTVNKRKSAKFAPNEVEKG